MVACADSDVGSWNPPAERLLVTGMPKMAAATMTSSAMAMMRLGALMASRAIRLQHVASFRPKPGDIAAKLSAIT